MNIVGPFIQSSKILFSLSLSSVLSSRKLVVWDPASTRLIVGYSNSWSRILFLNWPADIHTMKLNYTHQNCYHKNMQKLH